MVVIGDGAVGLCATLAARRLGAGQIIVLGDQPQRLTLARQFGASEVLTSGGEQVAGQVREMTRGGAEAVLECVGTERRSITMAVNICRPGGTVGFVGLPHGGGQLPLGRMFASNIGVRGGLAPARPIFPHFLRTCLPVDSTPRRSWMRRSALPRWLPGTRRWISARPLKSWFDRNKQRSRRRMRKNKRPFNPGIDRMEESTMTQMYRTLRVALIDEGVLSVVIDAPPMNLIGPELVRDLVTLLSELKSDEDMRVMVPESADPEYFVPHVDLTKVAEYTAEAAKAGGPDDASLGMLWHKLSELPVVTIAKLRGRVRGAGSELALACDMRFAARENAVLGQIEIGVGTPPGAGGVQYLARLLGRGRAMEVILGAADFDADEAERYGWVNRALPDAELDAFVARLARRIASFPADAVRSTKEVLNELTLPGANAIFARTRGGSSNWSARTRSRRASQPCLRKGCRPVARSNSTSATALNPCNRRIRRSTPVS